jgi:soluble lytic murein transglycosylase-like protein
MKAWLAACIVGVITFTGITYLLGGNTPALTLPNALPQAAASVENSTAPALASTAAVPALAVAVPETSAQVATAPATPLEAARETEPVAVTGTVSASSPMAPAAIGNDRTETKSMDAKSANTKLADLGPQDAVQLPSATRDAPDVASNPAPATQDFRYLIYYVWSELPPTEKPATTVLKSLKDIPVGTPVEEIKRAADAFGLDPNFMKAVAKIESGFDPKQRTGSYIGLFQLSKYEFGKYGSGQILDARDNAVAAAYKVITEGILFGWVTRRTPDLSDLYLIHQQGWEGAAEHISKPDRIAWKSMCATHEGTEKGEKWCKRAIWGNTLPKIKETWKSVDNLPSGAFAGMWRDRVAEFMSKYMATATAAAERTN